MISKEELKNRIISFIEKSNGCKYSDLKTNLRDSEISMTLLKFEFNLLIEELIDEDKLSYIEYKSNNSYKNKFLLPKDSLLYKFKVKNLDL